MILLFLTNHKGKLEIHIESTAKEQPLNYKSKKTLKLSLNTDELLFIAGGYDDYLLWVAMMDRRW